MSHELRTPLNAVLGFAQLLEMDPLPADQQRSVSRILRAGRHLLDLVNEVLDIARIEAGRLPLSPEPVRVRDVVREALDLVRPLAAEHHVTLLPGPAETCERFVLADRQRLKQVLLNLLTNAVKYNRPEGGVVTVSFEALPAGEGGPALSPAASGVVGRLRIAVRDTGQGIAPEKLDRLFTAFDRLGAESTGVEGTGLGLALAQRLTEAMGGRIVVESVEGSGTTFRVDLAEVAIQVAGRTTTPRVGEPISGAAAGETRRTRTVLYIEDNLPNLELIEELFARWPHVALVPAMQGRLGAELARQHRPDLILLDVHLPDIGGEEVLRQLQTDVRTRLIPVVVLSADATPGQITRLRGAGARAYLTKPLDVAQFLVLVNDILQEKPDEATP
jgi:CheY-like chemotaxis protein